MVALFGSLMGPDSLIGSQENADGSLSTQLAGVRVLFDETPAPLVYVYSSFMAAIVPYSTSGKSASTVQVEYLGNRSLPVIVPIVLSSPGIFTADSSGQGLAVALNENGTLNSASSPAQAGSTITLWATGDGQTTSGTMGVDPAAAPVLRVSVQIGGIDSTATYSDTRGLLQITAQIPQNVVSGDAVPVSIQVGTASSQRNVKVAVAGGSGKSGNQWFVSPSGSGLGSGSQGDPLDLPAALSGAAGRIQPGDTIWLRAGTYRPPNPNGFNSTIAGTAGAPIVLRNYQGERVTLDGKGTEITLSVNGGYTWFWGLEIMDSNTTRTTNQTGGVHPNAFGVGVYAPGVRFINNVVHDTAQGFSAYDASNDSIFYGNLSYYNGFVAPDRNHGHGFYMQNVTGTKLLQDNIVGDNADEGFQIYGSANANVVGFRIFNNASYSNSSWPTPNYQYNFVIAGGKLRKDIIFDQNYSFFDPAADYGFVDFGQYTPGKDITVTNSVFVGGYTGPTISMQAGPVVFAGNKSYVRSSAVQQTRLELGPSQNTNGWTWDTNQYYGKNLFFQGTTDGTTAQGVNLDFNAWKQATGFDANSSFSNSPPTGKWIYVRPNQYESKRANIIIYNWDLSDSVAVDLSGVLSSGDSYAIQDAQNFYGSPVVSGTYSGNPVSIPMKNLGKAAPVGFAAPAHTAPLFGTFVVIPGVPSSSKSTSD
jgi:uncharacterized protein (TIGR03437 family)